MKYTLGIIKNEIRMNWLLLIVGLVVAPLAVFAGDSVCPQNIPGEPQHWIIAICYEKSGTDDFEHPDVQRCVYDRINKDKLNMDGSPNCALNEKYKKEWCTRDGENEEFSNDCFKSLEIIPSVVTNGGA